MRACASVMPTNGSIGMRISLSGNFSARSSIEVPPSLRRGCRAAGVAAVQGRRGSVQMDAPAGDDDGASGFAVQSYGEVFLGRQLHLRCYQHGVNRLALHANRSMW